MLSIKLGNLLVFILEKNLECFFCWLVINFKFNLIRNILYVYTDDMYCNYYSNLYLFEYIFT